MRLPLTVCATSLVLLLPRFALSFLPSNNQSPISFVHSSPGRKSTCALFRDTACLSRQAPTTTSLSMGIMEEFLTSQDSSARGKDNQKYLKSLQPRIDRINQLEATIEELEDEELAAKTEEFRKRLTQGEDINGSILEEAFAVVREAAWRVLELRHYDVQLMGGIILHEGRLAEMATGEGKTLVATLPSYLNALLPGKSSFVITVNDYLARRDMEKMGQVHRFLGLTVGLIQANMKPEQRREAYGCDVVYVTNSELGFDYLRDHLALTPDQTVLPSTAGNSGTLDAFCLVDEADSVLIDEARTPLIISQQVPAPANKYSVANQLANALQKGLHYTVDLKNKNIVLSEVGYRDSENALGIRSLFELQADGTAWAPFVTNGVKAKELFQKDVEYTILIDDKGEKSGIGIIDSFTGRVLDGRRWSDGLHQSIEAKEGINVSEQSKVIAKVTYQSLFRQFPRLAGMTGTAMADASELEMTYGLRVTPVPTALPVARRDYPDVVFKTRKAANDALIREVAGVTQAGRPCLIGTTSVAQSEVIVASLAEKGVSAELLNASPKNAPRESEIIAQAGRAGVVTVATNMAGRGTDILLGGCSTTMARIKTRSVLLSEGVLSQEEAATLPPSPPEDYYPCPIDDDNLVLLKEAAASIKSTHGASLTGFELDEMLTVATDTTEAEDDPEPIIKLREAATAVKETFAAILAEEKEAVRKSGGLYVMGTNRHESSRIDQQLRGRSGRQGDPGSSRFFLSFEDDMFVIFGGEGMKKILEMFRVSDDMPVEAPQVTDALDKVQRTVEEKYREIRKEIFNFDETLNGQRQVVYSRRRNILFSNPEQSFQIMRDYNEQTVREIVKAQTSDKGVVSIDKVIGKIGQFFPPLGSVVQESNISGRSAEDVTTILVSVVDKAFNAMAKELNEKVSNSLGRSSNYIILLSMDNAWSGHLQTMENLKETVILRKFEGRDPVSEYRSEAFKLFQGLEDAMRRNAVFSLWQSLTTTSSKGVAQVA